MHAVNDFSFQDLFAIVPIPNRHEKIPQDVSLLLQLLMRMAGYSLPQDVIRDPVLSPRHFHTGIRRPLSLDMGNKSA